ncbi:K02A2.6-like [Cordylochernes scorpioides]|uniref:K02A2.6-like n=1 Tax=Cordylochernes scorpioides TaxID=51811 RepID=A0ABY6L326_9ARAC|nr:K02A2.6-like [Cordylochernes scorpioides]
MVEMFNSDPHWLKNVITGDETWVYGYDPETKRQSSQWLEPGEPRFDRARMIKSKLKCLFLSLSLINDPKNGIRKIDSCIMTTHGHIRPSLCIWLNMELFYYPGHPILLNLLLTTFSFTLKLKVLKGYRFDSIPEIKENTKNILKSLKDEDFQRCFYIGNKKMGQATGATTDSNVEGREELKGDRRRENGGDNRRGSLVREMAELTESEIEEGKKMLDTISIQINQKLGSTSRIQNAIGPMKGNLASMESRLRRLENSEDDVPVAPHPCLLLPTMDRLRGAVIRFSSKWWPWAMAGAPSLPLEKRLDYECLVHALTLRFGDDNLQTYHFVKLKNRRQKRNETLQELAADVERLARLAFPDCPRHVQDLLAHQNFVDAIENPEYQQSVRMSDAKTLQETLIHALKFEAARDATRGYQKVVRLMKANESQKGGVIKGAISQLQKTRTYRPKDKTICWNCGKPGNIRANSRVRRTFTKRGNTISKIFKKRKLAGLTGPRLDRRCDDFSGKIIRVSSLQGGSNELATEGLVNGVPCRMAIDSGANITLLRVDLAQRMGSISKRIPVSNELVLQTTTREQAKVRGTVMLKFQIGNNLFSHLGYLADIKDDCLIGLDVLRKFGFSIDFQENVLKVAGKEISLVGSRSSATKKVLKVILKSNVKIPPRSKCILEGRLTTSLGVTQLLILEINGQEFGQKGLLLARTLCKSDQSNIPIRVVNLLDSAKTLGKETEIALAEPVTNVVHCTTVENLNEIPCPSLIPGHLQELLEGTREGLNWIQQNKLKSLLYQYEDVFPNFPNNVGRMNVTQHRIDTGGATPVIQLPRRLPMTRRDEVDKLIEEMAEQDVIKPSSSPWASPVVLAKKKDGSTRSRPSARIDATLDTLPDRSGSPLCISKAATGKSAFTQKTEKRQLSRQETGFGSSRVFKHRETFASKTKSGRHFSWTVDCERAMDKLKQALSSPPMLVYPYPGEQFILDTHASNTGIGAVLSQTQDGVERFIAYFSNTLSKPERNYCLTCKDLLAIVISIEHFHHYTSRKGQLARWIQRLQEYDMEIQYRKGISHGNADSLSRRPSPVNCKHFSKYETQVELNIRQLDFAEELKRTKTNKKLTISVSQAANPEEIEVEKKKKTDVAQKHNIPQSSLSTIIKNSEKIHQQALHAGESSRKRARGSTYADDEALLQWFKQARSAALPVNGPLLSEKAKTLALEFGLKDFTGSGGWIERWKARQGMASSCATFVENQLINYACKDIFNADETGLFWRLLPDKTLHFKGETCTGGNASKERITILLCCNMDGSEKMQPLVIGKAKQPRCFRALTINLKQAVDIISVAWNDVLPATISNCWHHSGIIKSDVSSPLDTPQPATQMWEQQSLFDRMKEVLKIPLEMDFDSYADADNDVVTNAMLSDVEIVESILQAKEEEETDQVDEEVDPIVHIPHPKEVLESIQTLRLFLQCQDESKSLHRHLSDLDNIEKSVQHLLLTSKCQKKITNYFSKNT